MSEPSKKNTAKPIIGVVLIILVVLVALAAVKGIGNTVNKKVNKDDELAIYITEMVMDMNKMLPIMVDGDTRLEKVEVSGLKVQYYYTVLNVDVDKLNVMEWTQAVRNDITHQACQDPKIVKMFALSISSHFIYSDAKNNPIAQFDISKEICESFSYIKLPEITDSSVYRGSTLRESRSV